MALELLLFNLYIFHLFSTEMGYMTIQTTLNGESACLATCFLLSILFLILTIIYMDKCVQAVFWSDIGTSEHELK